MSLIYSAHHFEQSEFNLHYKSIYKVGTEIISITINCCILSLKLIECKGLRKQDGVVISLLSSSVSFVSFNPLKLAKGGGLALGSAQGHALASTSRIITFQYKNVR
jgi:hypothetical protein